MSNINLKKWIIPNIPYLLFVYLFDKVARREIRRGFLGESGTAFVLTLLSERFIEFVSFVIAIKILFFDKNFHILILTKEELFPSKDTFFTLL